MCILMLTLLLMLLIHRVELKQQDYDFHHESKQAVANPPCGVETTKLMIYTSFVDLLLIHRVELKPGDRLSF